MEKLSSEIISFKNKSGLQNITVDSGKTVTMFLDDLNENVDLNFDIKNDANVRVSIIADSSISSLNMIGNVANNSRFEVFFADFSINQINMNVDINLNENGANAIWHLASLADNKDNKNISVSIKHNAPETYGQVDNYGVCKNDAKLLFSGTSHIINGAIKSKTIQNAKIVVFDKHSDAIAKPILRIDENDIEANHSAAVGKINDEHLFYLTSRGISMEEARTIITLGYLKPIFKGFDDSRVEYLNKLIGGRL